MRVHEFMHLCANHDVYIVRFYVCIHKYAYVCIYTHILLRV